MRSIHALIVDDEPLAREIIDTHIQKVPNWTVVASCMNAEEAFEALLTHKVDVMLLDIQMPVISGIEFLQSLKNPPLVIFTTAYSEYALKGFELNVVDYLLKPISFHRFFQAVEKVQEKLLSKDKEGKSKANPDKTYMFVKLDGKLLKVNFSDILYIKAEQEYSYIYTHQEKLLVSMHLKLLENILPETLFTRIHRSYIIPQERVTSMYGNMIQIGQDIELPIGSTYKDKLLEKLDIK